MVKNNKIINKKILCSSRKYSCLPHEGQRKFRGEVGGGVGGRGLVVLRKVFFPGGLSKIGELLINNSFLVLLLLLVFQNKYYRLH